MTKPSMHGRFQDLAAALENLRDALLHALREWWPFLFVVPVLLGVSFWIWRAMILWVVRS